MLNLKLKKLVLERALTPQQKTTKSKIMQNPLDVAANKLIDDQLATLDFEADKKEHPFDSPAVRKARMKEMLKSVTELPELSKQIELAFKILASSSRYLEPEENKNMVDQFSTMDLFVQNIDLEKFSAENLQAFFKISDAVMGSVKKVAITKFIEQEYSSCIALFALLSTLNPNNSDYWFRLGIAEQKCENFELAAHAYSMALEMNPNLVEAWLFSVECYLNTNERQKAAVALAEAKRVAKSVDVDDEWISLISEAEQILAA